ncbi:MAG TPA: SIMPL domain-containing protein [Sphingomicrobium sp.]|nr:SIMPL domain-containing protein [Sphingomicrobium sp.]
MTKFVAFTFLALMGSSVLAQTPASVPLTPLGPNSALLSLSAEGRSRRIPDLASFNVGVVTTGTTAAEALAENSRQMDSVIAALKRTGVTDRDIQTSAVSLQPRYSNPERDAQILARQTGQPYVPTNQPPRIIGYEGRNTVVVRVRRLGEMGKIIDTLTRVGANEINGPSFSLDEPKAAEDEARLEAIRIGRERAELYARAAGMRVVRILSISEGSGYYPVQQSIVVTGASYASPPPPPPAPERDAPVAPGELTVGASVSMQFELSR